MSLSLLVLLPLAVQAGGSAPAPAGERAQAPPALSADDARSALKRGLDYLVKSQHEDGSWAGPTMESVLEDMFAPESFYAWQMASQAIACLALAQCEETPERRAALERGLTWLCDSRLPKRGDDWDIDYVWTMLYGFTTCVELVQDPRFARPPWKERLTARGMAFYDLLEKHQSVEGGWAYYDDAPYPDHPTWATSFSTACVIPALSEARAIGWKVDPKVEARAIEYVRSCALPNGAYAYSFEPIPSFTGESINAVKGSLGRIQVCNWALARAGVKTVTADKIRAGLQAFFDNHAFLDVARMKPIPHEAYYANAGYFYFFGHYYAAQAIGLLPPEERAAWYARLAYHVAKVQERDGSSTDFEGSSYLRIASTAFAALALQAGLAPR